LDAQIKPLAPNRVVAGPAYTILGEEDPRDDGAAGYRMFRAIVPGSVLVLACNGHHVAAPWGENATLSAQMRGTRGLVTDGGARDANAVVALGFPLFCRLLTPVFMGGRFAFKAHQQVIRMDGQVADKVTVRPGDFVMADRDGVVFVPEEVVEEVLAAAERLDKIEEQIRAGLRAGEDREVVYKRHPKFDHVRRPGR
jgi:4-hydroxy-4-methyl-2-oxoglutarate aldolase